MKLFLGGFAAVIFLCAVGYVVIRHKVRRFVRENLGATDIRQAIEMANQDMEDRPKSLNTCDSLLLPRILEDFPDFDLSLTKTYAKDALREKLKDKDTLTIYNVAMAKYDQASVQKSILFQAALSWMEGSVRQQKRYCLRYAYVVKGSSSTVAANCPNCGSPIEFGRTTCAYCGSQITRVTSAAWSFTDIYEG